MNSTLQMNRRSFVAAVAAVGGGFALGFEIPFGPQVVRAADAGGADHEGTTIHLRHEIHLSLPDHALAAA